MADSSPDTTTTRQTWLSGLPVMTWLVIALVFLVAITISRESDPLTGSDTPDPDTEEVAGGAADEPPTGDDATGDESGQTAGATGDGGTSSDEPADGDDSAGDAPSAGDSSGEPATTDPDEAPPPAPATTISASPPATTVAGAPPPATTTTVAAPAPPTTITVTAPPTTAVVTAPPTTIVVTAPPTTAAPAPANECTVLGTDRFGDMEIQLSGSSSAPNVAQLEIGFELRDGADELILPDFILVEFTSPGEGFRLVVQTFEPVPPGIDLASITCGITAIDVIELNADQRLPGPSDACSVAGVDDIGDLQLDVTVQNPVAEAADLIFTYAVRDPQGVRVMSDVGFADGLDPGQVTPVQVDTLFPPPAGIDPATLTCDIVGLELF